MSNYQPVSGDTIFGFWEDKDYREVIGTVVVLATSRSKRSISDSEGLKILTEVYGSNTEIESTDTWYRVTNMDMEGIAGDWHSNATGKGWIKVAMPRYFDVYLEN